MYFYFRDRVAFTLLLAVFWFGAVAPDLSAQRRYEGLFSSHETFIRNNADFTKWTSMLDRFLADERSKAGLIEQVRPRQGDANDPSRDKAIKDGDFRRCPRQNRRECRERLLDQFLGKAEEMQGVDQLEAVNQFLNQTPYILDSVNWGVEDYWETPGEFFLKDGDCEDYAISKYMTLKRLGWSLNDMRIAVINDENLRIPHAVLVVEFKDKRYILDNQADSILTDDKILHYRPVYSINETGWWRHLPRRFGSRFGR